MFSCFERKVYLTVFECAACLHHKLNRAYEKILIHKDLGKNIDKTLRKPDL